LIVYAESNFLLELALLQESHESCEKIVTLAEKGRLRLAIPAYSFVEPYATLRRRHQERTRIARSAREQLELIRRSAEFSASIPDLHSLDALFRSGTLAEERRFEELCSRLLAFTEVLPLSPEVLIESVEAKPIFDLKGQDSIVYASVIVHLRAVAPEAACFLNKDSKDFNNPSIVAALDALGCKLLPHFEAGLGYIESRLESSR
jgi:predicted nucleic acid-binding protein